MSETRTLITVLVENVNMLWKTDLFCLTFLTLLYLPHSGILLKLCNFISLVFFMLPVQHLSLSLSTCRLKLKVVWLSFFFIKVCGNYLQVAVSAAAVVFTLWTSLVPRGLSKTHMTRRNLNKYVVRRIMVSVFVIFV